MYQLAALVHLLAAATWLGGLLFIALVLVPLTRRLQTPPGAGIRVLVAAAQGFRPVGWASLALLVLSGVWLLTLRGVGLGELLYGEGTFHAILRWKVVLVIILLALTALHDFVLGPRLAERMQARAGNPSGGRSPSRERSLVSWLARLDLLLTLVILALGVMLVRGRPF